MTNEVSMVDEEPGTAAAMLRGNAGQAYVGGLGGIEVERISSDLRRLSLEKKQQ